MSSSGPRLRYRTAADVRAIPNDQWEQWISGVEACPPTAFSAEASCQMTVRYVAAATRRRMEARR